MCQKSELIDTLWNVNLAIPKPFLSLVDELIDTLWNVNSYLYPGNLKEVLRINRYIMECKYAKCYDLF